MENLEQVDYHLCWYPTEGGYAWPGRKFGGEKCGAGEQHYQISAHYKEWLRIFSAKTTHNICQYLAKYW